jgi:hypothetical protein
MTSEKQLQANRKNAQKSTGPRTAKGKAKISKNAFKHGLLSEDIIIPGEDPKLFAYIKQELVEQLDPIGFQEAEIAERMAVLMWRLRRVYRVEARIFAYEQAVAEVDRTGAERKSHEVKVDKFLALSFADLEIDDEEEYAKASEAEDAAIAHLAKISTGIGRAFMQDAAGNDALSKLSRYETAIDRSLSRLRTELEWLQRMRKEKPSKQPVTIDNVNEEDC